MQEKENPPNAATGNVQPWHARSVQTAIAELRVDPRIGLSHTEAIRRLQEFGPNILLGTEGKSWYIVLMRQFTDTLILILFAAAAVAFAVGETTDAVTILAIIILNGLLGFTQEWKAERALEALKHMLSLHCTVLRDGHEQDIDATTVVPGDIILLETGNQIPADLRLVEALNLRADESSLTGESSSVTKRIDAVAPDAALAEQMSMAWMGTAVTNGRARGVVVATGMATEFGRIAQLTQSVTEETTPLQRKLSRLGRQLGVLAIVISVTIAVTGWLTGKPLLEMFLIGVALAVAVVPEGLPAVVTITLALGIRAMVRRRAILRRLQAAEALGAATVICTDKTGTLTENEMTVQRIWLASGEIHVTGVGYEPTGDFLMHGRIIDVGEYADIGALLETGLRCNHAHVVKTDGRWQEHGEPTEAALVVAAAKAGLSIPALPKNVAEFSFNSNRKRMTIVQNVNDTRLAHVKGAPEVILERCRKILDRGHERELTGDDLNAATMAYETMASQGLRTLALARRSLPADLSLDEQHVERDLTLLGVVGIIDPPRPEVPDAIALARTAGIRVIMVTGDAAATALSIARRTGLDAIRAVTGKELSAMDDATLRAELESPVIFARTTPEHKLRIVTLLQAMGHIVGMTGDGVNDAPALKKADIGIAMGIRGTDVAKGASDMVLTDDNFASIIWATEEGRRQYDNIKKFVRYLLSSNTGEVIAILFNIILGGPLILRPAQILWMNLVTDGMTAVALGLEPKEQGVMQRPPRPPAEPILDRGSVIMIALLGGYIGLATLWLFHYYLNSGAENAVLLAQTVAFTGIVMLEKFNVFNFRTLRAPLSVIGLFSNPWIILAWTVNFGLQVSVVYVPVLQRAFHTVPLGVADWGIILMVAAPIFIVTETFKWIRWRAHRAASVMA